MWYKCSKHKENYNTPQHTTCEVLAVEYRKKITVLWDVTPFIFVVGYQRFGETCCFHLHVSHSSFEYFHPHLHFPLACTVTSLLNCQHSANFSSSHSLWLQKSERTLNTQEFVAVLRDIFCKCCSNHKFVAVQPQELGTNYIFEISCSQGGETLLCLYPPYFPLP